MATYCTIQNTKATITVKKNGSQIKLSSSNPPIDVSCKNNLDPADCTKVKVTVTSTDTVGRVSVNTYNRFSPILGLKIHNNNQLLSIKDKGNGNTCGVLQWWTIGSLVGLSYGFLKASITSIEPLLTADQPAQKGVIIKDRNGTVLYDDDTADCLGNVVCDDDCPPGTCKCSSPVYPGYCCNDCASTAASIHTITSELRAKNG